MSYLMKHKMLTLLMLGILLRQKSYSGYLCRRCTSANLCGGAVNAMQQLPLPESRLTTSFRFGEAIADVANALLGGLNETVPLLGNPNQKSSVSSQNRIQKCVMRFCVKTMPQWSCYWQA